MKKIVLSLAGVMAAAAFAPEASALPVFARQTGMACSACHFQHFPMLNSFGRSFKSAAFTMVGSQGKVEGDRLSIPDTLNMAVLTTAGYEKTNAAPDNGGVLKTGGNGVVYVPGTNGEFSLFVGGRVSDNAGFLSEIGAVGAAGLASAKLPILYPVGDSGARAGVVFFTTDGQGASYGFETLNTGANAIHQMSPVGGLTNGAHGTMFSAQQYIGTGIAATGAAIVVNSDMGFINVTKYHGAGPGDTTAIGTNGASLGSTYLRAAYVFDMAGWDSGVGIQSWTGSSLNIGPAAMVDTKATAVDFQMMGTVAGDKPLGVFVTYARAPVTTTTGFGNIYNQDPNGGAGTLTKSSFNVAAEIGVIPEVATLQAAIRRSKSGVADAAGANEADNGIMVGATYKLAQNMVASISYTSESGSYWTQTNIDKAGSKTTTINLFTLF